MKVLKFSCVSGLNSGDSLISHIIEEEFKEKNSIKSLDILGYRFDLAARKRSRKPYRVPKPNKLRNYLAGFVRWVDYRLRHRIKFKRAIESSDMVFIGGGQIIDDFATGHMLYRIMDIVKICRSFNVRVIIGFVGVSKLRDKNFKKLARLAPSIDRFCVRDPKSLARLNDNSINALQYDLVPDPVFIISKSVKLHDCASSYIGVNVMNINSVLRINDQNIEICAANLIEISKKLGMRVRLILTSFGQDLDIARELEAHFKRRGQAIDTKLVTTPESVSSAYAGVDIMFSHRMHASIIAMSYGIPCLVYNWHTKIEGLETLVNKSGLIKIHQDINFEVSSFSESARIMLRSRESKNFELGALKSEINNYFSLIT